MSENNPKTQMPKWLVYGLVGKAVLVALIVAGVLLYVNLS